MKRFLLFYGSLYYPRGGWEDYEGDFDSIDDALAAKVKAEETADIGWFHVVDRETMQLAFRPCNMCAVAAQLATYTRVLLSDGTWVHDEDYRYPCMWVDART